MFVRRVGLILCSVAYTFYKVTIGGSICTELLTNKGWTPANTIEAVIVSIRAGFLEGGARLDLHNKHDYSIAEAKDAFDRMVQTHGWY
jgi:ubiquitin-conjugating enzyme E2 Q